MTCKTCLQGLFKSQISFLFGSRNDENVWNRGILHISTAIPESISHSPYIKGSRHSTLTMICSLSQLWCEIVSGLIKCNLNHLWLSLNDSERPIRYMKIYISVRLLHHFPRCLFLKSSDAESGHLCSLAEQLFLKTTQKLLNCYWIVKVEWLMMSF